MSRRRRFTVLPSLLILCLSLQGWAENKVKHVEVTRLDGAWTLLIDGKSYFIQGVGLNQATGEHGEDYLRMAKDMGANTVRTWGGAPRSYLDAAETYGLMVNLGVWLIPIRETGGHESYRNPKFTDKLRQQILIYVREMKDHPALLTWNIGNEAIAYTEDPQEKEALAKFLESVIQDVHRFDPDHPVIYSCSADRDLPMLKKHVPSLDIIGTNIYGSLSPVLGWMRQNGHDKPVVVTEFGPIGAWDSSKDRNNMPFDPPDHIKSNDYASVWRQIEDAREKCLGGFAFVLGEHRNQDSLSWYNLNHKDLRRDAFSTMYTAYRKRRVSNRAPKILEMKIDKVGDLIPGQRIDVRVKATDVNRDRLAYEFFVTQIATDPLVVEPPRYFPVEIEVVEPGRVRLKVPNDPGQYRVYVVVTDGHQNAAIADRSIVVIQH